MQQIRSFKLHVFLAFLFFALTSSSGFTRTEKDPRRPFQPELFAGKYSVDSTRSDEGCGDKDTHIEIRASQSELMAVSSQSKNGWPVSSGPIYTEFPRINQPLQTPAIGGGKYDGGREVIFDGQELTYNYYSYQIPFPLHHREIFVRLRYVQKGTLFYQQTIPSKLTCIFISSAE